MLANILLPLKWSLPGPADGALTVHLQKFNRAFPFRITQLSELRVLREIMLEEQYAMAVPKPPEVIVDLGSHVGASAIYFSLAFPSATIYAVEPNPDSLAKLRHNTAPFENVKVINRAIAGTNGWSALYVSSTCHESCSLMKRDKGWRSVEVPTLTLDTLRKGLKLSKIDLLKIDVEGAELEVLEQSDLQGIETVVGEVHCDLMQVGLRRFSPFLKQFRPVFRKQSRGRYLLYGRRLQKGVGSLF
jgi:FkbM family methyltransferase